MAIKIVSSLLFLLYYFTTKCTSLPHLYQITEPVDHAEGPTWDSRKNMLYFVDIHAGTIYSYEYPSGQVHSVKLNGEVAPVVPSKYNADLLLVGLNRTLTVLEWNGKRQIGKIAPLVTISSQFPTSRFNDGKADKEGRLWFGTMGFEDASGVVPNQGLLYKFTREFQNPDVMIAPVNVSNGLAWNRANTKFYYIDTPTRKVLEFDYDNAKGEIGNGRVVFDVAQQEAITGFPDGMTIDENDHLWIALYGGGAVIKVDPTIGRLEQIVAIPAEAVTSCMWGGPHLDILFVTTSRFRLSREQRRRQPAAGSVFALLGLEAAGLEMNHADIVDNIPRRKIG